MQTSDTRRDNLRALAEIHGSANLSRMLGYRQPSFISQMIGPNPTRTVSERNARDYEQALKLPDGYLDAPLFPAQPVPAASVVPPADDAAALLAEVIRTVNRVVQAEGVDIRVDQFAKLLAVEVTEAANNGFKVREAHVKQMLAMIA
jgi:hypothetical protein